MIHNSEFQENSPYPFEMELNFLESNLPRLFKSK